MATTARHDESLVERHEVLFPNTDMIDTEPFYNNFTTIENLLRYSNQQKQLNTLTPTINGCIFNLIQIVEDIGYNSQSPFINSKENNPKNALYNLILKLGGAFGLLVNRRRLNIDKQYFQRWYLEKYPSSASMIQHNLLMKRTTQISDDYQSNINRRSSIITKLPFKRMDDKTFKKQVLSTYGFDDTDTISSISSSRRSSIDETNSTPTRQSTPVILETVNSKPKQQITIREYYPSKDIPSLMASRSISAASQQTTNDNEYEEFIHNHPGLYHDLNPEIIRKSNPDQITYKQNVSVRYLVPPTPPPSGPLIIRGINHFHIKKILIICFHFLEIIPPHPPTPPPLIINQQDPTPPTPPPLILREAPSLLPPHQEPTIITKVLPQESSSSSSSSQRVIIERDAPVYFIFN